MEGCLPRCSILLPTSVKDGADAAAWGVDDEIVGRSGRLLATDVDHLHHHPLACGRDPAAHFSSKHLQHVVLSRAIANP